MTRTWRNRVEHIIVKPLAVRFKLKKSINRNLGLMFAKLTTNQFP